MFLLSWCILEIEPGVVTHLHQGGYVICGDEDKIVLFGNDRAVYEKYIDSFNF